MFRGWTSSWEKSYTPLLEFFMVPPTTEMLYLKITIIRKHFEKVIHLLLLSDFAAHSTAMF